MVWRDVGENRRPNLQQPGRASAVFQLIAALAAFFVLMVSLPVTHAWDIRVTTWLEGTAPTFDVPASILVLLGNAEVCIPGAALVGAVLLLPSEKRRSGIVMLSLAADLVVASLLVFALQNVIVYPGPGAVLQDQRPEPSLPFGTTPHSAPSAQVIQNMLPTSPYSFPSGHSIRVVLLAATLFRVVPWFAGIVVLSMMAALVYVGGHWPSDVVAGLCLGWVMIQARTMISMKRS
jgi:membrane-associated phospholipid phosphatase